MRPHPLPLLAALLCGLAAAQIVDYGERLTPDMIPANKLYTLPLPIPPVLDMRGGGSTTIKMRKATQFMGAYKPIRDASGNIVDGTPLNTEVFAYGTDTLGYKYPGPTILTETNVPVTIDFRNELPDEHILWIDRTFMCNTESKTGVNCQSREGKDTRTIVHLHGAHVDSAYDGSPLKWYTNSNGADGDVGSEFANTTYVYTNDQNATMLFYHDHAMGITKHNVAAGLVGLYVIDGPERRALNLPSGEFDVPLIFTGRYMDIADGVLARLSSPKVTFDADNAPSPAAGGSLPEADPDNVMVNGVIFPYLNVSRGTYLFRLLNAHDSYFTTVQFHDEVTDTVLPFTVVSTDQGLLTQPATVTSLLLGPAERYEVLVDFSKLREVADGEEYTIGLHDMESPQDGEYALFEGRPMMKFRVGPGPAGRSIDPATIELPANPALSALAGNVKRVRQVVLNEKQQYVGHLSWRPQPVLGSRSPLKVTGALYEMPVTEVLKANEVEMWEIINLSPDRHPIHVHLVHFAILNRQVALPSHDVYRMSNATLRMPSIITGPEPHELGPKDTVVAPARMVTRILMKPDLVGDYLWHCHILAHEDNTMMRPMKVVA